MKEVNITKFVNPTLALLSSGFLYSLYGPLTRITGEAFGPLTQTAVRAGLRLLFLLPIILVLSGLVGKTDRKHWKWFILISLAAAATNIFYILAVTKISMATTMFLFYALGVVSAFIVGRLLYKERLTRAKGLSLLLALSGVLAMFVEKISLGGGLIYLIYAAIAGLSYGIYASFSKKVSTSYTKTHVILVIAAIEIPVYLFFLQFFHETSVWTNVGSWTSNVVYAALVLINSYLIVYGYKHLEAQKASILLLSELVFIVVLGMVVYSEVPTTGEIIGSVLILLSLVLPNVGFIERRLTK